MRSRPPAKAKAQEHDWSALGEVAVVDCLATGHDVELDRLVWLAAVLLDLKADDDPELAVVETLVDPRIPIPAEATLLHGVAAANVVGHKHFGQIAGKLRDLLGHRPVVGFNVRPAAGFLDAEMRRHGHKTLYRASARDIQDALCNAWGYRPTLSNAVARLGIEREEASSKASNAIVTARLALVLASTPPDTLVSLPGDRWVDEDGDRGALPATRPQLAAVRDLGGDPGKVKTTRQAEEMIDSLRRMPTAQAAASDESVPESRHAALSGTGWAWVLVLGLIAMAVWLIL